MTNYNERLDEILSDYADEHRNHAYEFDNKEISQTEYFESMQNDKRKAKQAITSLIKELVAEAKPEYRYCGFHGGKDSMVDCSACNPENMVDVYRKSLLEALEEV